MDIWKRSAERRRQKMRVVCHQWVPLFVLSDSPIPYFNMFRVLILHYEKNEKNEKKFPLISGPFGRACSAAQPHHGLQHKVSPMP